MNDFMNLDYFVKQESYHYNADSIVVKVLETLESPEKLPRKIRKHRELLMGISKAFLRGDFTIPVSPTTYKERKKRLKLFTRNIEKLRKIILQSGCNINISDITYGTVNNAWNAWVDYLRSQKEDFICDEE